MKFNSNDSTKKEHAVKLQRNSILDRMEKHVPEAAKQKFNRKPYQIGGKANERSGKDAAKD